MPSGPITRDTLTYPLSGGIVASSVSEGVAVVAIVVACKCVVPDASAGFYAEHKCRVVSPSQTEEAGQEILGRFCHTVLGSRSGDDLAAVVGVEVTVHNLVQGTAIEKSAVVISRGSRSRSLHNILLLSDWDQDFGAKLIRPGVQEAEVASECDIAKYSSRIVVNLSRKLSGTGTGSWVPGSVARQHIKLDDGGVVGERVLVHAKSARVREVVGELPMQLEDVAIVYVAHDRNLSLEWAVRDVCCCREGCRVCLCKESGRTSWSWAWEPFDR